MTTRYELLPKTLAGCLTVAALISCGGGGSNSDQAPPGEPTARNCFDSNFLKDTTAVWDFSYDHFQDGAASPVTSTKRYRIESTEGVFGDQTNLIVLSESETTLAITASKSHLRTFLRLEESGNKTIFGITSSGNVTVNFVSRTEHYSPAYVDPSASLKAGESVSIKITGRYEQNPSNVGTGAIDSTTRIKYLGNENVTTPAGTFNACKFDVDGQQKWLWRGFPIQFTEGRGLTRRVNLVKLNNQAVLP